MQNICRKQYLVVESVYMLPNARRASFEFFLFAQKKNYSPILKPFLLGTRSSRIFTHGSKTTTTVFEEKKSTYRYQQLIFLFLLGFLDFVKNCNSLFFLYANEELNYLRLLNMPPRRKKLLKETKLALLSKKQSPIVTTRRRRSARKLSHENKNSPSRTQKIEDDIGVDTQMSEEIAGFLNSSPIKQIDRRLNNSTPTKNILSSSPIKTKKSVAFSDDLISDIPSTPDRNHSSGRSILKSCNSEFQNRLVDPSNTSLWRKANENVSYGPKNPDFWLQGTIVQLPPNSPDLYHLIEGCITVLQDASFDKRFEVYATLNGVYKTNSGSGAVKLFSSTLEDSVLASPRKNRSTPSPLKNNSPTKKQRESLYVALLAGQIIKDIEATEDSLFDDNKDKENRSPTKNDPFRIRIVNQATKLMSYFILDQELNKLISLHNIDWLYHHACVMLTHPKASKAIISAYLVIMKECKLSAKKKKALFETGDLAEKMLFALINMKRFPSSSLVSEQFMCFKNFVNLFPGIMAKNISHWFGMLLLNICEVGSPFYLKCFSVGVHCLLEVAKAFLDNRKTRAYVKLFLSSPFSFNIKSMSSSESIVIDSDSNDSQSQKVVDIVLSKLLELIHDGQFKEAMDIWVALTVLVGYSGESFERWEHLSKWLQITKLCFNSQVPQARVLALSCWKAIIFNLCRNDLDEIRKTLDPVMGHSNIKDKQQQITTVMKPKVKLLTYLFGSFNAAEMEDEVIDTLHNLFVAILYSTINPLVIKLRTKYLHILWDKVFQFVFINFYFKKDASNARMSQLGFAVLSKLIKSATPVNERNFNEVRCLSNEPVSINEVNSLPPRWIYSKFDKIMQNMILIFLLENLHVEDKIGFFIAFLASIKPIVKNEALVSPTTFDIIDNIPIVLSHLFKTNTLSHDLAIKLIVNLHDTFTSSLLVRRANKQDEIDTSNNIYLPVLANCSKSLSKEEYLEIFQLITQSLSHKKILVFIADYVQLGLKMEDVKAVISDILAKRTVELSSEELGLYGEICQYFDTGFETFVKKLIQTIVVVSDSEKMLNCFENLNITSWNYSIVIFLLLLLKNAPNKHIFQFTINLIEKMMKSNFIATLELLTVQDFEAEIFPLMDQIYTNSLQYSGETLFKICLLLKDYLEYKLKNSENHELVDRLLLGCYSVLGIDVSTLIQDDYSKYPNFKIELDKRNPCIVNGKIVVNHLQKSQESDDKSSQEQETSVPTDSDNSLDLQVDSNIQKEQDVSESNEYDQSNIPELSADSSTSILDINTVDTVNKNIATEISSKSNLPEVEQFCKVNDIIVTDTECAKDESKVQPTEEFESVIQHNEGGLGLTVKLTPVKNRSAIETVSPKQEFIVKIVKKKPEEQVQESSSSAKDDDEISDIETSSVSQGNGNGIIEQPEVLSSRSSNGTLVRKREHPEESLAPSKRSKVCESTNSAEDGLKVTKTQLNANEKSLPLDDEIALENKQGELKMSNVDVDFNGQQGENIQVDSCNFSSINNNSLDPKTFAESIVSTDGEEKSENGEIPPAKELDIECTTSPDLKNSDNSAILETNNDINKKDTEEEKEKMKEEQYSMVQEAPSYFLPLKEFEEIKSKKEIDDDFENSVGYRSNGISKSYSPMDLVDLLSTKSDAELACITSDEKYEMETKLLNLMVRLRNLK